MVAMTAAMQPTPAQIMTGYGAFTARRIACGGDVGRVIQAEIEATRDIVAAFVGALHSAGLYERKSWMGNCNVDEIIATVSDYHTDLVGDLVRLPDDLRDWARENAEAAAADRWDSLRHDLDDEREAA